MCDDLTQKLLIAETDFLDALEGDGITLKLASFNQAWSALPDLLHAGSKTGSIAHETLHLAHFVASRITNLAECFLNIRHREESSTASLQSDCDILIHRMASLDINANPKSLLSDNRSSTCPSHAHCNSQALGAESSFVSSAYQWLTDNLHNPYPTTEVKDQIAATFSSKATSVSSWFINARRRIGWTTLCREHFSNCRANMIDAAYRALVEEDPRRPLSPKITYSFMAMKMAAEDLYPSTFTRSTFARDLESIVEGIAEKDKKSNEVGSGRVNLTDSYPSPDRSSTTSSPLPSLDDSHTDASEEDENVVSPVIAGSKRPRSFIDPPDRLSCTTNRPVKRLRASMASQTCLPSPSSSVNGIDEPLDRDSPEVSVVNSTPLEINQSRKRVASDANNTVVSKRPRMATPRPQVVSDPLPHTRAENEYSIDDWFNTNFDALFAIPPPADATEPDFSSSWEVELFKDYSIPENSKHTPPCPFAPTDLCDFDGLLQSISSNTSVTSLVHTPDVTESNNPTSFNSLTPDIPNIPDLPPTDIDWSSLLNTTETYPPVVDSTFLPYSPEPQPLPVIDIPMLQSPQVAPASNRQPDFESKEAKLQRLRALQEAVRQMEQELQSEGVVA